MLGDYLNEVFLYSIGDIISYVLNILQKYPQMNTLQKIISCTASLALVLSLTAYDESEGLSGISSQELSSESISTTTNIPIVFIGGTVSFRLTFLWCAKRGSTADFPVRIIIANQYVF